MKRWISLIILAVTGLVALLLVDRDYRADVHQENAQALAQSSANTRNRLQVAVNTRLLAVQSLQAFMLAPASLPDNETFDRYAAGVLDDYPSILALQYVDSQGIIRYIYPLKGNERALGLNLMARPTAPFVEKTIRERRTAVTDPVVIAQGVLSIVSRAPLFRGNRLLGLAAGVFDVQAILKEISTGADPRFALQLRDAKGNRFWETETSSGETQTLPVQVGDNSWTLIVGWGVPPPGPAPLILGMIWGAGGALLLSLLFIVNRYRWLRQEVVRRTQFYTALSQSIEAIVRCASEEELLPTICRIAVQLGGMQMAWIGFTDPNTRMVRPAASFGDRADEYLRNIEISVDADSPLGRGPTGTAIRENQAVWCQDFQNDPRTTPWHERGARSGWGASACLPLHRNQIAVGALTLYSGKVGAFDAEVRRLLVSMASNISTSLDNFAREAALHESEELFRETFYRASVGKVQVEPASGRFVRVNPVFCELTGYTEAELLQKTFVEITSPEDREADALLFRRLLSREIPIYAREKRYIRKDGAAVWTLVSVSMLFDRDGNAKLVSAVVQDITERKRAETLLAAQKRALEMIASGAALAETLDTLVRTIEALVPEMLGSIMLLDEDGLHLRHGAAPSLPESYNRLVDGLPIGEGIGSCGTAAYRKEQVIAEDITSDPLWENYRDVALQSGQRACWSTPIFDKDQRVLGTFALYFRTPRRPTKDHLQIIASVTYITAIAISSARDEAALRESENRFRALIEASAQIVWTTNTDGEVVEDSPSWRAFTGQTYEQWKGFGWLDVFHPEDRERVSQVWRKAVAEKTQLDIEYRIRHISGDWRWTSVRAVPLLGAEGKIKNWVGMNTDITERKQAEAAMSEIEEKLRLFIEHAPAAIAMFDRNMRYIAFSQRWLSDYGLVDKNLTGISHYDIFPDLPDRWKTIHQRCLGGAIESCEEDPFPRRDGSVDWIRWEIHPWHATDGRVAGIILFSEIITERKRAEDALRESEVKLRRLIDGLGPDHFVGLLTADGVIIEANRPALEAASLKPEDVVGKPVEQTYWFAYSESVQKQLRTAVQQAAAGVSSRFDVMIRVSEGTFIWLDFAMQPLRDGTGKITHLIPSAIVITERKRAEEALRESEAKFRTIIESSPVAMAMNDEHQNVTFLNRKFVETFGYTLAEIPTLAAWWPRAYPDPAYRQRVEQEWQAAVDKAQRDRTEFESMEHKVTGKDGAVRDIRFSMSLMGTSSLVILYDLTESKRAEQQLRELSRRITEVEEAERKEISRELHDRIGQNLARLTLSLNIVKSRLSEDAQRATGAFIDNALALTKESIAQVRNVISDLRPAALDDFGLLAALRIHAESFAARNGINISIDGTEIIPRLPPAIEIALFRIAQEALNNIAKHAQVSHANVLIKGRNGRVSLTISDDGTGFVPPSEIDVRSSFGLAMMRERAQAIGATLRIESTPDAGTLVSVDCNQSL